MNAFEAHQLHMDHASQAFPVKAFRYGPVCSSVTLSKGETCKYCGFRQAHAVLALTYIGDPSSAQLKF